MIIDTNFKLNTEVFFREIAMSSLNDIDDAYDAYGSLDEGSAHRSLQLIKARMETMMSFLESVERPATQQ